MDGGIVRKLPRAPIRAIVAGFSFCRMMQPTRFSTGCFGHGILSAEILRLCPFLTRRLIRHQLPSSGNVSGRFSPALSLCFVRPPDGRIRRQFSPIRARRNGPSATPEKAIAPVPFRSASRHWRPAHRVAGKPNEENGNGDNLHPQNTNPRSLPCGG
jgi:hypothetical protein